MTKNKIRQDTEKQHNRFVESVNESIHCKLNSEVHTSGCFIEIGQLRRATGQYHTNGYWYNESIKVLVFGNEKIHFYFDKDKLWDWMVNHKERIGYYRNGKVKGISLTIKESYDLASMVVKL